MSNISILQALTKVVESTKGYVDNQIIKVSQDLGKKVDKETGKSLISDTEIARLAKVTNYNDSGVTSRLAALEAIDHSKFLTEHQSLDNYATKDYVSETVAGIIAGGTGLDEYAKIAYVDAAIGNLGIENYALKDNSVLTGSLSLGRKADTEVGAASVALGDNPTANGTNSFATGRNTVASGSYSFASGNLSEARGNASHAEGRNSVASGSYSHAEGNQTFTLGAGSHSEGTSSKAATAVMPDLTLETTADAIIAAWEVNKFTLAKGSSSHVEGFNTLGLAQYAHAEGSGTIAAGMASHTEGIHTHAGSNYQHAQGKYNIIDNDNKYAHIVGNGTADNARSNAHTLDWEGNAWYAGKLSQEGTPIDDKDLTTKKYTDSVVESVYSNINKPYHDDIVILEDLSVTIDEDLNVTTNQPGALIKVAETTTVDQRFIYFNITNQADNISLLSNSTTKYTLEIRKNGELSSLKEDQIGTASAISVSANDTYPAYNAVVSINRIFNESFSTVATPGTISFRLGYIRNKDMSTNVPETYPVTFKVTFKIQVINEHNITNFATLKESPTGYGICRFNTRANHVGSYSINLGDIKDDCPNYSLVLGRFNDFGSSTDTIRISDFDIVNGYNNTIKSVGYSNITGYSNQLTGYGNGMSCANINGKENVFTESKDNNDKFLTLNGNKIKAIMGGAYFGVCGTVPASEIFAICHGTTIDDEPIMSVNRTTGAVTAGEPTEDNHLTTKKYVDDSTVNVQSTDAITQAMIEEVLAGHYTEDSTIILNQATKAETDAAIDSILGL